MTHNTLKILLIGGTGAIGKPLAEILADRGDVVYVTTRSDRKDKGGIRYVKCNGHDLNALREIMNSEKWDVIVDFLVYSTKEFDEHINNIIHNTKQYIFVSSARVFAESSDPITEESPRLLDVSTDIEYLKSDEYALRKARCENILTSYSNYTIVRPSVTFNTTRLQLGVYEIENWLDRTIKGIPVVLSRDILTKVTTLTHGDDVARALAGICGNPKALCESYNIATEEYFTWEEISKIYFQTLEKLGIKPQIKLIDQALNLKIPKLKYQVKYARLFNRRFDNSKLQRLLPDFKFSNVKEDLIKCTSDYIQKMDDSKESLLCLVNLLQDREAGYILPKSEVKGLKRYLKYLVGRFMPESKLIARLS